MLVKTAGVYTVAAHHFRELIPGEQCVNKTRPCEGISSFTELMSYASIVKLQDMGVSHYGVLTETEKQQLDEAKEIYLANIARGGSH